MKLLIDIGNTRLKWALARDGLLVERGVVVHAGAPSAALRELPAVAVDRVLLAHVTGNEHEGALDEAVRVHYGAKLRIARTAPEWRGLHNAYREPQRLGVDRWLAMVAVWHERRGRACVVDAGTALTADVIGDDGQHRGGFIAGGLATQQVAVLGATRFATRDQEARYDDGLGDDTESCVRQGAMLACLGAIDRAAMRAGSGARCVLTGGDAERLLPYLDTRWSLRPALVLEGLLALDS